MRRMGVRSVGSKKGKGKENMRDEVEAKKKI